MKLFGIHIIRDKRLSEKLNKASTNQRILSNGIVSKLLNNGEVQRRQIESIMRKLEK